MNTPIVVVGLGQLGAAFSTGFLRRGHPVFPVSRDQSPTATLQLVEGNLDSKPLLLVAVGEDDLAGVLEEIPESAHARIILIQNELRPATWRSALGCDPTVAAVWFEKKSTKPIKQVRWTPVAGPFAEPVIRALVCLGLDARAVEPPSSRERDHQLALKNLYILSLNLAGLKGPSSAGELLGQQNELWPLVDELISIEQELCSGPSDEPLDGGRLRRELIEAIEADPEHGCAGRSAPRRLQRTVEHVRRLGLACPRLLALAASQAGAS